VLLSDPKATLNLDSVGQEMYQLIANLYPICRSITGNGVRQTLRYIQKHVPLSIQEIPSETSVFDWTVPKEWNIKDAYVKNSNGEKVIDFQNSNLHVVSYSTPVRKRLSLDELKAHLFTLPDHPDWIPYRTTYYKESWGFCLSHKQFLELQDEEYEVCIDSSLEDGHLTYGEYYLPGERSDEVLLSCHICHPSLCTRDVPGEVFEFAFAEILVSLCVYPWNHRIDHLALCQRSPCVQYQARLCSVGRWRCRQFYIQKKPSWRCGDRPGLQPCLKAFRQRLRHYRFLPLWL
jgi:aminopeptidase-like protein